MLKKVLKSKFFMRILSKIAYIYARVVFLTCKWEIHGDKGFRKILDEGTPLILSLWHGRIFLIPNTWKKESPKMHTIVSNHSDGEILSYFIDNFNIGLIRGSTAKNDAAKALRKSINLLKSGDCLCITPDGPRGPNQKIGGAIVSIASKTSTPIVPVTISVRDCKIFSTWDKFMLPLPFSRGVIYYGNAIRPPEYLTDSTKDAYKQMLENEMNSIIQKADEITGVNNKGN